MSLNERGLKSLRALVFVVGILLAILGSCHSAFAATKIKVGALEFGSFSWLLDTIQHHGFDKAEGIDLEVVPLASTEATRVGLLSQSLDLIVTDWLGESRAQLRREFYLCAFQPRTWRSHGATQFGHQEFG